MKILRRIFTILVISAAAFLVLILILAGLTQTRFFKDELRDFVISRASSGLNGTLSMGSLGGNFFTGFTIDSIAFLHNGDTVISARKVIIRYEPVSFFRKSLEIRDLVLEQPLIYFSRPVHGEWNIGRLFKSSSGEDTSAPSWAVNLHSLEIQHGEFILIDSLALAREDHRTLPDPSVEYHRIHLRDVNVKLSASIRDGTYSAHISNASFYSIHPQFRLTQFKANLEADNNHLAMRSMLLQTGQSYIELDAEMTGIHIFTGVDLRLLEHARAQLHLRAGNVSFAELQQFLSPLEFLKGSAALECDASGEFGNLKVERLVVSTMQSSMKLSGTVQNLHEPDSLYLIVAMDNSKVNPADANRLMPSFSIPPFSHAGISDIRLTFVGHPTNFSGSADIKGPFGRLKCEGALNLSRSVPVYHARFTTDHLKTDDVFDLKGFHAILTASGEIAGEGFDIETLNDSLLLKLDTTEVQRLRIDEGIIKLKSRSRQITVNSSIAGRDMNATLTGSADFTNQQKPSYSGDLTLQGFDLSKILNDDEYRSRFTLRTHFNGEGKTIDDLSGKISISLLASVYQDREIQPQEISFSLDQHNPRQKRLFLQASFADAELNGRFDLDVIAAALTNQSRNLISAIQEHASPPDSTGVKRVDRKMPLSPHTESERMLDFSYKISVNDLEPLAVITGGAAYNARGSLEGKIKGADDLLTISASGNIDEFFIGSVSKGIFLTNTRISLSAKNLTPYRTLEQLALQCSLSVGTALLNKLRCNNFSLIFDYNNLTGHFFTGGEVDSFYTIRSIGQASIQPHTYALDFDTLSVDMQGYRWLNDQDVQIRLNYDGIRLLHADMKRNNELVSFVGVIHHTGDIEMTGMLRSFQLQGINVLLRDKDLLRSQKGFFGICDADLDLSGSLVSPVIHFSSSSQQAYYRQSLIGSVKAQISYRDQAAEIDASVFAHANDTSPTLLLKGTLPINLSFQDVDERFPDAEQHLQLFSDGFDVSILDPLLADFDNLSGKLLCTVNLLGTPRLPRYDGTIKISDVRFVFGPNNITYIVNGEFEPSGNKLLIRNLTASNPASEPKQSDARFTGAMTIKNFQVDSFDVTAFGQLLLMTDATRKSIKTFYGTLFAETDANGLNLRGTLQEPFLSGNLSVISADLVFPPTKSGPTVKPNQILNYVRVEDSLHLAAAGAALPSRFYRGYDTSLVARSTAVQRTVEPSFVDRLRYHLDVETRGTTAVRMIFTPSTGEELYAEIEGRVTAINDNGTATIYNEISVTPRSYYNFFNRFDATGKLTFVGPWDNPELHIDATYEGYRQIVSQQTSTDLSTQTPEQKIEQKVIVTLKITGTRYEPKLDMGMKVQLAPGTDPVDWATRAKGGDIQSDAISFIITGKFREDLTTSERDNIAADFGSAGAGGLTSNLLSGIFTDFLRKEFPFIRNAEISYGGGNVGQSANFRVSGEAFNGYFRVGGRILNDLGNTNVSYQTSVGDFLNMRGIRNLFIELERRVEGDYTEDRSITNNARLYYRFSF